MEIVLSGGSWQWQWCTLSTCSLSQSPPRFEKNQIHLSVARQDSPREILLNQMKKVGKGVYWTRFLGKVLLRISRYINNCERKATLVTTKTQNREFLILLLQCLCFNLSFIHFSVVLIGNIFLSVIFIHPFKITYVRIMALTVYILPAQQTGERNLELHLLLV